MNQYLRAVDYLTVAQLFLAENHLLKRSLTFDDVKSRILGHWGTGPGINFAYAHLSRFAKKYDQDMMFVLGPGHGFPALQANLFLEGTLTHFDPSLQKNLAGIERLCRQFSWPYGYPSHSNPETPGVILEGGELGYSLATSYGAVMDNPGLIVACLIGDGEAETGPTAGAWQLNKLVNPRKDGVVLPILHLNGYKISAPTVYGRMSNYELMAMFSGLGYEPRIVDATDCTENEAHDRMAEALDWVHQTIEELKSSKDTVSPRMPMLIMRTLKGWTGPRELDGQKIEGNALAHQTVLTEAKTDKEQLQMLNDWLKSYKFDELFSEAQGFGSYVEDIFPADPKKRMGMSLHANGGIYQALKLPNVDDYAEDATAPGTIGSSSMRRAGAYLAEVFRLNAEHKNFRFMSPDETYSNKLDEIFSATSRSWQWPIQKWDMDLSQDGRVMEMLSEHNMQGLMQGYVLTGRHAMFASYEAFLQVVSSMVDQYAKFLTQSRNVPWRDTIASINYILTSSGWRQDHNGFSHQNPGFIDDILRRQSNFSDVYFPADGNCTLVALEKMLTSVRQVNAIVAGKTLEPRWLTTELARKQIDAGLMIWDFATDEGTPDLVMAAAGDYPTKETMAAIDLIKTEWSSVKIRCVNVSSLTTTGFGTLNNTADQKYFDHIFTEDKPVIFNFHGYPQTIKAILFNYAVDSTRFDIRGYKEIGSTTTPFDMHVRNETSRYDLVIAAFKQLGHDGVVPFEEAEHLAAKYRAKIEENTAYIKANGIDLPEIDAWVWPAARGLAQATEEAWHGQAN